MSEEEHPRINPAALLKIASVIVIAAVLAWAFWGFIQGRNTWRAVFLINNQVYFGHFYYIPLRSTITLSDIYYLQVSQPLQPTAEGQKPEIKIIKFGKEIHGPQDKMMIPKSQLLFWEDLRYDSPVVKAIREDKSK